MRSRISRAALLVKVTTSIWLRPRLALGEDVGDARGQHARLARAGAGEHQQRPLGGQHRFALFGVEALQVVGVRIGLAMGARRRRRAARSGACRSRVRVRQVGCRGVLARAPRAEADRPRPGSWKKDSARRLIGNGLVIVRPGLVWRRQVRRPGTGCPKDRGNRSFRADLAGVFPLRKGGAVAR